MIGKTRVLVITEHDHCAGPMAAAFLRDYGREMEVVSVGRYPAEAMHPLVVPAMKECLLNMENTFPKGIHDVDIRVFDFVYEIPERIIPAQIAAFRSYRDRIKNDSFLYYRDVIRKNL